MHTVVAGSNRSQRRALRARVAPAAKDTRWKAFSRAENEVAGLGCVHQYRVIRHFSPYPQQVSGCFVMPLAISIEYSMGKSLDCMVRRCDEKTTQNHRAISGGNVRFTTLVPRLLSRVVPTSHMKAGREFRCIRGVHMRRYTRIIKRDLADTAYTVQCSAWPTVHGAV